MEKIETIIPIQSFEIVRDRIASILTVELAAQYALTNNESINAGVWIDRFIPFDRTELPAVNIMLDSGQYEGDQPMQSDGVYVYNIDCYSSAKSMGDLPDSKAMNNLQRLLGVCRAILQDNRYITLDFKPPFVFNRKVLNISIADPQQKDTGTVVMGRVQISVKVPEYSQGYAGIPALQVYTNVKIELTDKGYQFIYSP